jgi:hypothetical protein
MPVYSPIHFWFGRSHQPEIGQLIRTNGMANSIATMPSIIRPDVKKTKESLPIPFSANQDPVTMIYLPKKCGFPYSFDADEQNMLSLRIKNEEIFEQRLPAEECKAFVH